MLVSAAHLQAAVVTHNSSLEMSLYELKGNLYSAFRFSKKLVCAGIQAMPMRGNWDEGQKYYSFILVGTGLTELSTSYMAL